MDGQTLTTRPVCLYLCQRECGCPFVPTQKRTQPIKQTHNYSISTYDVRGLFGPPSDFGRCDLSKWSAVRNSSLYIPERAHSLNTYRLSLEGDNQMDGIHLWQITIFNSLRKSIMLIFINNSVVIQYWKWAYTKINSFSWSRFFVS